jgi:MFS family permease
MSQDLILLAISMFTWGVGEGLFLYFQPLYLEQLGADPIRIGAILGGFGLSMTIAHIPAGYLADRIGRRPLLIVAWILGIVATWMMALATALPLFVTGLLLYGITLFVISPLNSYITAARGVHSVGRAITLVSAGFNLGAVIGPLLGGAIADHWGLRQNYFIAAWIFVVSTILIFFIHSQPVEKASQEEGQVRQLLHSRYLAYLTAVFLAIFAMYLPQSLSPNFLQSERALSVRQIGVMYSLSSVGVVVLNLFLGQLPARVGFLLAQVAVGFFALLLWLGTGLPWYQLGFFLLGGYKTARSLGAAQVREMVHQARMGLAYGLTETVSATATVIAPPLSGYLYTLHPYWMYAFAAGLIALSILVSARFSPRPEVSSVQLLKIRKASRRSRAKIERPGEAER